MNKRNALRRETGTDFLPTEDYLDALIKAEGKADSAYDNYIKTLKTLENVKKATAVSPKAEALCRKADEAGGPAAVQAEYNRLHNSTRRGYSLGWLLLVLSLLLAGAAFFLLRPLTLSPTTALPALAILALLLTSIVSFRNGATAAKRTAAFCRHYGAVSGADLLCRMQEAENTACTIAKGIASIRSAEDNIEISKKNLEEPRENLLALSRLWDKSYELGPLEEPIAPLSVRVRAFYREDKRLSAEIAEIRKQMLSQRAKLAGENEIMVRAQVPPGRRESLEKVNFKTIQEGLVYYRSTCESLHEQYTALLSKLNEHRRTAENPALLRAELAAMEERVADLRRRYRAYGIALDAIESASDRLRAEISPRLSEYSGKLLEIATDGRYASLSVTNRLLMTFRDDEGREQPAPFFSGSTSELAYLSLRLALIDMLYKENPPLCFDGTLAQQDDNRARSIMTMLDTIAGAGTQSILLTAHRREAEIASSVSKTARCLTI